MDTDGRKKFDAFYKEVLSGKHPDYPTPPVLGTKLDVQFPPEHTTFDFYYDVSDYLYPVPHCVTHTSQLLTRAMMLKRFV